MAEEMGDQFGFLADVEENLAAARVAYDGGNADVCAAHAAMAAVGLVQRLATDLRLRTTPDKVDDWEEPAWERNDVVRSRLAYQLPNGDTVRLSVYYLLQERQEGTRVWRATVIKANEGTGATVGASTYLNEGGPWNRAARFPD